MPNLNDSSHDDDRGEASKSNQRNGNLVKQEPAEETLANDQQNEEEKNVQTTQLLKTEKEIDSQ